MARRIACAHALHLRAHLEQDIGDVEMAEALWLEAVSLLRTADDPLQLAHKVRHLGDVAVARGRTEEAAGHFDEALRIYRSTPGADDLDLANALSRVADAKAVVGRIEDARALWLEAKESYAAAGVTEGVLEAERHLRTLEPPPSR